MRSRRKVGMSEALRRWLRRLRGPLLPSEQSNRARLIICRECGAHLVNPIDWHESGDSDWWIRLRCGACGDTRTGVFSDADAKRLDRELAPGMRTIEQAVARLDRERMGREADAFIAALDRDLIGPADFARRAPR
jgi:ribosomal protein S27E